ncbi:hypothetical protein [Sphingomonas glacialis]|nr:hypothetical protein [Sphingomonas glacialis]
MTALFIPLIKADASQRLVWGSFDETPDRAGEVCDYATAKPAFQAWSEGMSKASGGQNLGNIRGQHDLKKAAGKLISIEFDDTAKRIDFCAKIVDDQEWKKVEELVYTGFSPGGSYAKRWVDGAYQRYTPRVGELSIVDCPCNPSATFTMVKADGSEEQVEFVMSKAYEPGNDATKTRAEALANAAGGNALAKNYVVQARADLIAENAAAELAKMAEPEVPEREEDGEQASAADALTASLAKADAAIAAAVPAPEGPFANLAKAADAVALIGTIPLAKSLWSVEWLTSLLRDFACLQSEVTWDENFAAPGDADMTIPTKAAEIVKAIGELLVTMTQEGVADLLTNIQRSGVDIDGVVVVDGDDVVVMELANQIVDLVKADTVLMEKAGARNSKGDAAKIQSMHDNAVELGATCDTTAEKVEQLSAENERLAKAVTDAAPKVDRLVKTIEDLTAENKLLKATPAPVKGVALVAPIAVSKEADAALAKADEAKPDESHLSLEQRAISAVARFR